MSFIPPITKCGSLCIQTLQYNMLPVNTYVVWDDTKEAVVIDPGCYYSGEGEHLCGYIHQNGLTVRHLLNTHQHFDHVFGNPVVEQAFGIHAEGHAADRQWMIDLPGRLAAFGMKFNTIVEPIMPENYIDEGDRIEFGHSVFEILHVPGHSPGSIAFYCREANALFTGDALFRESIGRTDMEDGDHDALINAIRNKLAVLPDETIVFPGHGPYTTIRHEKDCNPFI